MKVVLSFLNPYLIDEETQSQTGKAAFFKGTELVTRETWGWNLCLSESHTIHVKKGKWYGVDVLSAIKRKIVWEGLQN